MTPEIQIRAVTVEMLRPGPAHNQLLSPLTQYLGICDDAEAGIVTQPYEHAAFLRRMASMRYDKEGWQIDRLPVLREMGIEMAKVLGSIVTQARGPHLIVFKKRRRQNSRRKNGHRQDLTVIKIEQIVA